MDDTTRTPSDRARRARLAADAAGHPSRGAPWPDAGRPALIPTTGILADVADGIEEVHLGRARVLLDEVSAVLQRHDLSTAELRGLVAEMREALTDALRVADSRGIRLCSSRPEPER